MLSTGALLAGCTFLGGDRDDEIPSLEAIEPLAVVETPWSTDAGAGIGREWLVLEPAVEGGRVFAADASGRISAFGSENGRSVWRTDTGAGITGGVGAGDGLVIVGTGDGEVLAVSADRGAIAWRATVSSEVLSPPRVAEGRVIVRTLDGKLFGLDAGTGEPVWNYDGGVPSLSVRGTGSPAIVNGVAIAGFDNGRLAAVRSTNGEVLWGSRRLVRTRAVGARPACRRRHRARNRAGRRLCGEP